MAKENADFQYSQVLGFTIPHGVSEGYEFSSTMGRCPTCGKQFELHVTVGPQRGLRVGDIAVCVGCASALVLEQVPYEYRLMTEKEIENLDYDTRKLLEKAQANIREDAKVTASGNIQNSHRQ